MREIDQRLADTSWDLTIARNVVARRKRHNRLVVASGTLLTVSLCVVSLAFYFNSAQRDPINQQIWGIYQTQYSEADELTGDDTDSLLIEILAMR